MCVCVCVCVRACVCVRVSVSTDFILKSCCIVYSQVHPFVGLSKMEAVWQPAECVKLPSLTALSHHTKSTRIFTVDIILFFIALWQH